MSSTAQIDGIANPTAAWQQDSIGPESNERLPGRGWGIVRAILRETALVIAAMFVCFVLVVGAFKLWKADLRVPGIIRPAVRRGNMLSTASTAFLLCVRQRR